MFSKHFCQEGGGGGGIYVLGSFKKKNLLIKIDFDRDLHDLYATHADLTNEDQSHSSLQAFHVL